MHHPRPRTRLGRIALIGALAAASAALTAPAAGAASSTTPGGTPTFNRLNRPFFKRMPAVSVPTREGAAVAAVVPLKTFNGSFTTAGTSYRYTMVGTAPTGAAATTTVANSITPLTLKFSNGTMALPAANLTKVRTSGLFTDKVFPGGTGQYGDVFMRTMFWSQINAGAKNWHVKLAAPTVRPTLTLTVPSTAGSVFTRSGTTLKVGFADINWLDRALRTYVSAPAANVFTQLLTNNIVLCDGPPNAQLSNCGIGGYHSLISNTTGKHTYSYQSYLSPAIYGAAANFKDIAPMSHELAEWLADPYIDNITPYWTSPISPQYGCDNILEVGDPLVGKGITVGGLFYQDEAYLSFFSREAPSKAWQGRYSWFRGFTTASPSCTPAG